MIYSSSEARVPSLKLVIEDEGVGLSGQFKIT